MRKTTEVEYQRLIAELRERNRELRQELRRREGVVHFDFDGMQTSCGKDVYEVDSTDELSEVTCRNCKSAYERYKRRMDKEWQKEQKEHERREASR